MDISNIFNSILNISIISSVIGIIIILLRQILKGKVNSKWIYIIWFILLFKLVAPIRIESVFSLFNFTPESIIQTDYTQNFKNEYEILKQEYDNKVNEVTINKNNDTKNQDIIVIQEELNKSKFKNNILEYVIPCIWFVGCILMLVWLVISNIILNLKLKKFNYDDTEIKDILYKCKEKMGIKRKIDVVVNDAVSVPALFGFFKVKILIPKQVLNLHLENIEYILLHELSHYKRKDILLNYVLLVIQSIHWFNPVIWLCFKLIRNDLELATDEYALKYLSEDKYKAYANALVETLKASINMKLTPRLIGMVDGKENIKRRIVMIKSLEIFKKKKVVISTICIAIILVFSVFLLTSPIVSDEPNDNIYISSITGKYETHRGAYKWKNLFGEIIADSIEPLEYAKTIDVIKCSNSEKININSEKNFKNMKEFNITELENNINVLNIANLKNKDNIEFVAPDQNGIYYYLIRVTYENESYVEYVFSIEVVSDEEIVEDTSEKVAKLNKSSNWNDDTKTYDTTFVKEISQNEIENIEKIFERAEKFLGTVSWANIPNYEIEFNDEKRNKIEIRISEDKTTISVEEWNEALSVRTIYAEEDVNYILNLLGEKNEYASLPIINLDEYNKPMDIYWYGGTKFELGTYSWKTSRNDDISSLIISDAINPQQILEDKEAVQWLGAVGTSVTIYSRDEKVTKKLPRESSLKYKIYKSDEKSENVEYENAIRMIDGSYYLTDLPRVRGEYIVEIYLSFGELSNNDAHYCIKYEF